MAIAVKHLSGNGATEITSKSWSDITAGTSNTPAKFFVWNVGDRALSGLVFDVIQVGTGDGYLYVQYAADTGTLSCPWGFSATAVASGGSIASGVTYYYKITGTNATGETTGSLEVSATTTAASSSVNLAWTLLPSATGYKIYRSSTSNSYGASSLLTTIASGSTVTYTDTGTSLTSGTIPSANTTGGASSPDYGIAPTLGSSAITIGTLEIGRQWIYWVGLTVGASVTESGNTRYSQRRLREA